MKHNIHFFDKQYSFKKTEGVFFLMNAASWSSRSVRTTVLRKENGTTWGRREGWWTDWLWQEEEVILLCLYQKGRVGLMFGSYRWPAISFFKVTVHLLLLPSLNLFPHSLFILLPPCCTPSPFILINLLFSSIHSHLYVPLPQVALHLSLYPPHLSPTPPRLCQGCPL